MHGATHLAGTKPRDRRWSMHWSARYLLSGRLQAVLSIVFLFFFSVVLRRCTGASNSKNKVATEILVIQLVGQIRSGNC